MFKRPIVGIAICMAVGIFVGYAAGVPLKFAYISFFVFSLGSLVTWIFEKQAEKGITFIFICLSIFFLGMTLIRGERQVLLNQSRTLGVDLNPESSNEAKASVHTEHSWRARRFHYLSIRGTIVNYPEERSVYRTDVEEGEEGEDSAPQRQRVQNKISFPLKIEQVKRKDTWQGMAGKILVNIYSTPRASFGHVLKEDVLRSPDPLPTGAREIAPRLLRRHDVPPRNDIEGGFRIGDRIEIEGDLRPLPEMRNPDDFDYGVYLLRKGIVGQMSIRTKREEWPVLGEPGSGSGQKGGDQRYGEAKNGGCPYFLVSRNNINFITRIAAAGRDWMEKIIDLGPYDNGRENLLKAMLIGKREDLGEVMKQNFINTGTVHIMAISGLHLVIVMAIILFLCRIISLPQRFASIACIVFLILYAFLTGGRASVWRATIMSGLYLGSRFFNRQVDKWTTFSMAGLIILFISPQDLFDSGFQLTFMAVAGLMYFYPRLEHVLRERGKGLFRRTVSHYLVKSILTILAAQIALGPFLIYYYYRFPMTAFIANLAIVPLLGIVTVLGFVSSLTGLISLSLARAFNATNNIFLLIMDKTTSFLSILPGQVIYLPKLSPLFFLLYYGILFLLFYPVRLKPAEPIAVSSDSQTCATFAAQQRGVRRF